MINKTDERIFIKWYSSRDGIKSAFSGVLLIWGLTLTYLLDGLNKVPGGGGLK